MVSDSYHREPMRENFAIVMQTMRLLFPLIDAADEQLFGSMQATGVMWLGTGNFVSEANL